MTRKESRSRTSASAARLAFRAVVVALACGTGTALGQSVGDFNGDGYADLAIGAPGDDYGFLYPDAGAVDVIYGSAAGLDVDRSVHHTRGGFGDDDLVGQNRANTLVGSALAVGDFNDDGYDDLAIGATGEPFNTGDLLDPIWLDAGSVTIVYGTSDGLYAIGQQIFQRGVTANVEGAPQEYARFGFALAAGDFDGNGADDLAVGIPFENVSQGGVDITDAGAVQIFYGNRITGLTADDDEIWFKSALGKGTGDRFGYALAAGDFDADGSDDLAVGVPNENATFSDTGSAIVFYGTASGLSSARKQTWTQNSPGVPDSVDTADHFGWALAAGDLNGDGAADLAIGVPDEDIETDRPTPINCGGVNVLYGVAGVGLASTNAQFLSQANSLDGRRETSDRFGHHLAIGHLTADLRAELVVGIPGEDGGAGAIEVYKGGAAALSPFRFVRAKVEGGASPGDGFATVLAVADFNGDGMGDIAVGVPFDDFADPIGSVFPDAGSITVFSGQTRTYFNQGTALFDSPESGDNFGLAIGR